MSEGAGPSAGAIRPACRPAAVDPVLGAAGHRAGGGLRLRGHLRPRDQRRPAGGGRRRLRRCWPSPPEGPLGHLPDLPAAPPPASLVIVRGRGGGAGPDHPGPAPGHRGDHRHRVRGRRADPGGHPHPTSAASTGPPVAAGGRGTDIGDRRHRHRGGHRRRRPPPPRPSRGPRDRATGPGQPGAGRPVGPAAPRVGVGQARSATKYRPEAEAQVRRTIRGAGRAGRAGCRPAGASDDDPD